MVTYVSVHDAKKAQLAFKDSNKNRKKIRTGYSTSTYVGTYTYMYSIANNTEVIIRVSSGELFFAIYTVKRVAHSFKSSQPVKYTKPNKQRVIKVRQTTENAISDILIAQSRLQFKNNYYKNLILSYSVLGRRVDSNGRYYNLLISTLVTFFPNKVHMIN